MSSVPWYKSWTLWVNLFALVVYVAMGLGFQGFKAEPWVGEIGGVIVVIINLILRYYRTSAPIDRGANTVKTAR